MKKRFALLLAGAMLLTAALTGCGTDKPADEPADNPSTTAPTDGAPAADGEGTPNLDAIREKGEIVMLTNAQFPPFESTNASGEIIGVDVDIANEIAKDLGVKLKIVDMDFDGIPAAVEAGKGDFAAAGMSITEKRMKQGDFTIEYVTSSQYVVIPKGSSLTADDAALSGKTIACQDGTTGAFYAAGDESWDSEIKDANVLGFKSGIEAGMAVASGKADALIIDELPAKTIVEKNADKLELLPEPLTTEKYAFMIAKGKPDLVDAINSTLQRLLDEGRIDEMILSYMAA